MNLSPADNEITTRIITDEPTKEAPDFREYSHKLSKIIINSYPRFTVGIYGDWGTGKTTLMQMIKEEIDDKYDNIATTIWFDAWRYEKEEYSAMIPLLRTIILTLENAIVDKSTDSDKKKSLKKVQKGFVKTIKAVFSNAELNIGGEIGTDVTGKIRAGATFDIRKILDEYKSEGDVIFDQKKIYFHQHVSDHLKEELVNIRNELKSEFRLVIFIDDLDRCTPERALEILESIKTFFDIEGIIYVIGMDPLTIDPIIKTKYGDNHKIDGMNYLQKIVQLPFQIPVWSSFDLSKMIGNLVKKAGLSESYSEEILKDTNQELIINATQLNPRDIKRFINSIVLARDVYGQDIENIDKIIAIQAFYFHGRKWIEFLKLLIPYEQRIAFLTHFIVLLEIKSQDITILDDLNKIIKDDNLQEKVEKKEEYQYQLLIDSYREDKLLNDIYNKLIEINDKDLFIFLKIASVPLLKIDKIDSYLKIVDTTGLTSKRKEVKEINSKEQLEYLQNKPVKEFNDYNTKNILIHLPFADLQERKLPEINLRNSMLFKAKLIKTDLYKANLSKANLIKAILSGAILSEANLSEANLSMADLSRAILSGAYLYRAILSEADLSGADLSEADLSRADLSGANLSGAILSEADLSRAILSEADLSGADLSEAILSGAILSGAKLYKAILSEADLSRADLTEAKLSKAILSEAKLYKAILSKADLSGANLSGAILSGADLSMADLTDANFTNSIIINNAFSEKTVVLNANFENAIIDNPEFIKHLHNNNCQNIPEEIKYKQELMFRLERKKLDENLILDILDSSKLPST